MSKPAFDPNQPFQAVNDKPAFDPTKPFEEVKEPEPEMSGEDARMRGYKSGGTFGWNDELAGLKEGAKNLFNHPVEHYTQARDAERALDEKAQKDHPWQYLGAKTAGSLPGQVAADTLLTPIGGGAVGGFLQGLGDAKGTVGQQLKNAGINGAIGAGTAGLLGAGGKLLGNKLVSAGEKKAVDAVASNPAQIEKALKYANKNEIGRTLLDEGVVRPYRSAEGMLNKAEELKDKGWNGMKKAFDEVDAGGNKMSKAELYQRLQNKYGKYYADPLNADELPHWNKLNETIDRVSPNDDFNLNRAQELKSKLDNSAKWDGTVSNGERDLFKNASREARKYITDTANKYAGNSPELNAARKQYQAGSIAEGIDRKVSRENNSAPIKLTDLGAAELAGIKGVVAKHLVNKYGKQTAAYGLDQVGKAVQNKAINSIANPAVRGYLDQKLNGVKKEED